MASVTSAQMHSDAWAQAKRAALPILAGCGTRVNLVAGSEP